jgi:SAM-dependent methyltransferase
MSAKIKTAAPPEYWQEHYGHDRPPAYNEEAIPFSDLFREHVPQDAKTCFEVGCYPGNFLLHFALRFGCRVSGLDSVPQTLTELPERFARYGVTTEYLFCEDFFNFSTSLKFDIVMSYGFIEHFYDVETVIDRHAALLSPGGTLIVAAPNFRRIQWFFHRLLDRKNLDRHVIEAMDLARWRSAIQRNNLDILFHGYWRTADFWYETPTAQRIRSGLAWRVSSLANKLDRTITFPNPYTSPFMISIARAPEST